ncbi:MAG: GntR family transcriptional regulator [Micropepsaceae bacterium]
MAKQRQVSPKPARAAIRVRRVKGLTLRELAYDELRRSILGGRFAPGEAITIAELSGQMGIGVMPTREAVQQLASRGAFEFLPNRSVRVPVIAAIDLASLFEARLLLEGFVTARAAENITPEEVAQVAANLEALIKRLRSRVAADCLEANFDFHFSIYRASRSPYVVAMIEHLWLRMSPLQIRVFRASPKEQDEFFTAMPMHRKLVEYLRRGDRQKAQSTITQMLTQSLKWHLRHAASTSRT